MKKQLLFGLLVLLLVGLTSASVCKGSDGYYHDCSRYDRYSDWDSDYSYSYNRYYDYEEYSYEREYYQVYSYEESSRDYESRRNSGSSRNRNSDREQFRPSEYLWKDYPNYNEYGYFDYDKPSSRSLYDEIFYYR